MKGIRRWVKSATTSEIIPDIETTFTRSNASVPLDTRDALDIRVAERPEGPPIVGRAGSCPLATERSFEKADVPNARIQTLKPSPNTSYFGPTVPGE